MQNNMQAQDSQKFEMSHQQQRRKKRNQHQKHYTHFAEQQPVEPQTTAALLRTGSCCDDEEDKDEKKMTSSQTLAGSLLASASITTGAAKSEPLLTTTCVTAAAPSSSSSSSTSSFTTVKNNNNDKQRTISRSMLELDSAMHVSKFEVIWHKLSYSYKPSYWSRKAPAVVLREISGSFASNKLVALIGPSGCGKTTFLQCLAGNDASYCGSLRIIGLDEPKVALIGQDDCLLPGLTAKETLVFASRLQNNKSNFDHGAHCLSVLKQLGIGDCSDKDVAKLSGGQAKRVTIAKEILYPTNILVLDEVTSGLDATTSFSIIRLLKKLVSDQKYPMTIVMSIHQPSARLFSLFDQVYVMSEGSCMYSGSCAIDTVNNELQKFGLQCPKFHNIADYLIEIASVDDSSPPSSPFSSSSSAAATSETECEYSKKLLPTTTTSTTAGNVRDELIAYQSKLFSLEDANGATNEHFSPNQTNDQSKSSNNDDEHVPILMDRDLFAAVERARKSRKKPLISHTLTHLERSQLRIKRSYILTYLQVITYVILGFQLSTFYGRDIGSQSACPRQPISVVSFLFSADKEISEANIQLRRVQENLNFLLVSVMTTTFAALEITVLTFPLEAKTVKREWRNGWYRTSSYFLGRTLADLPFQVIFVIIFSSVIYTLTGQVGFPGWRFVTFTTVLILTALIAQTVGFIFGAIFMDNLSAAVFTAPLCIFPALLFSGFFSRVANVPIIYMPLTYLSHFRYAFDSILITLYGYNRCDCNEDLLKMYKETKTNQSTAIKDIFQSLFGAINCDSSTNSGAHSGDNEIIDSSIDDNLPNDPNLLKVLNQTFAATAAAAATSNSKSSLVNSAFADSLIENINKFHFSSNSTTTTMSPEHAETSGGVSSQNFLVDKFTNEMTTILNSQSNYGHVVPNNCSDYNPYLINEFNLKNQDLIIGLSMMVTIFVVSRIFCNIILATTIRRKS